MTILTPTELLELQKNISALKDRNGLQIVIEEAEENDIRPVIGDSTYLSILDYLADPSQSKFDYTLLLNGGEYQTCCNRRARLVGLKKTISYFAFARTLEDTVQSTRFGAIQKIDQYSIKATYDEYKTSAARSRQIGDNYLTSCMNYLKENCEVFTDFKKGKGRTQGSRIRIAGK